MITHYLSTAIRHFSRHRITTATNVLSLAIGITGFLALFAMVTYVSSSDTQWPRAERIYAITQKTIDTQSGTRWPTVPGTAFVAAKYLRADLPELELVARALTPREQPISSGTAKSFATVRYVEPQFLEVFPLRFIAGESRDALRAKNTAVLTESRAIALFGSASAALGRTVVLGGKNELRVVGVVASPPQPSHLGMQLRGGNNIFSAFDTLVALTTEDDSEVSREAWNVPFTTTYVVLPADGSLTAEQLRVRLDAFGARHAPKDQCTCTFGAIPVNEFTLLQWNGALGADRTGISVLAIAWLLSALVLGISCINYANLASAQALTWMKEVGMRRVIGAARRQIVMQSLLEAGLIAGVAFLLAFVLIAAAVATLDSHTVTFLLGVMIRTPAAWVPLIVGLAAIVFAAGVYPALMLARVRPVHALRGGGPRTGSRRAPQVLVAAQFVAAGFLLVCMFVMYSQSRSLERSAFATLGDPIVIVANSLSNAGVDFTTFRTELERSTYVKTVGASYAPPFGLHEGFVALSRTPEAQARRVTASTNAVQGEFFQAFDFRVAAGRTFDSSIDRDWEFDGVGPADALIDRQMLEEQGFPNAADAVGKTLYQWGELDGRPIARPLTVVGVVESKPLALIGFGTNAALYIHSRAEAQSPVIRIDRDHVQEAIRHIDATWNRLAPHIALKRQFGDERMTQTFGIVSLIGTVVAVMAGFALVIALLGLIGMSMHFINRRTHEIGVRKTLGASVSRVVTMLLRDLAKPIVIANLIAWPLAFVAMRAYLNIFIQRSALSPTPFLLSLALTLAIAWLAVGAQATRAARVKPVEVLRYE